MGGSATLRSQSPYGAKWFATVAGQFPGVEDELSQSPYGAKWFATEVCPVLPVPLGLGRNPLTGLSGLQLQGGKETRWVTVG